MRRLGLLLCVLAFPVAFAQVSFVPGRPTRGAGSGGFTSNYGFYTGPIQRCMIARYNSQFGESHSRTGFQFLSYDTNETHTDFAVDAGTVGFNAIGWPNVGAGTANTRGTIYGAFPPFVQVNNDDAMAAYFRFTYRPSNQSSSNFYVGLDDTTTSAQSVVACGTPVVRTNALYVACDSTLVAMKICANANDGMPECTSLPSAFLCNDAGVYDVTFTRSGASVSYWAADLTTGTSATGTFSDVPEQGSKLNWSASMCNGDAGTGTVNQRLSFNILCLTSE